MASIQEILTQLQAGSIDLAQAFAMAAGGSNTAEMAVMPSKRSGVLGEAVSSNMVNSFQNADFYGYSRVLSHRVSMRTHRQ